MLKQPICYLDILAIQHLYNFIIRSIRALLQLTFTAEYTDDQQRILGYGSTLKR